MAFLPSNVFSAFPIHPEETNKKTLMNAKPSGLDASFPSLYVLPSPIRLSIPYTSFPPLYLFPSPILLSLPYTSFSGIHIGHPILACMVSLQGEYHQDLLLETTCVKMANALKFCRFYSQVVFWRRPFSGTLSKTVTSNSDSPFIL